MLCEVRGVEVVRAEALPCFISAIRGQRLVTR